MQTLHDLYNYLCCEDYAQSIYNEREQQAIEDMLEFAKMEDNANGEENDD